MEGVKTIAALGEDKRKFLGNVLLLWVIGVQCSYLGD